MSRRPNLSLRLILGCAGLGSALLVRAPYPLSYALPGAFFGIALSACLWFSEIERQLWKLLVIALASWIALPVSLLAYAYLEYFSPWPLHTIGTPFSHTSKAALFAGGAAGAFLVLAAVLLLVTSKPPAKALFTALCWSLVTGALGIIGGASASLLGTMLAWQGGMGFLVGIMLAASNVPKLEPTAG